MLRARIGLFSTFLLLGACKTLTVADPRLEFIDVKPGGEAMIVVRPIVIEPECAVVSPAKPGERVLDCNTSYILACNAKTAGREPFCRVARETGPVRESGLPPKPNQW